MKAPSSNFVAVYCAALLVAGCASANRELPEVEAGQELRTAADFELTGLDGEAVRLSSIDSPVIVLHFWSKFRDCDADLAVLDRLNREYAPRGVKVLGLAFSSGTREEVAQFLAEKKVEIPTLMCSSAVKQEYDVATFPTTFLLDGDRHLRYWMYGILVPEHWDQLIREMLAEN